MLTLEPVFKSDDPKYLTIESDAQWVECDRQESLSFLSKGRILSKIREHSAKNPDEGYFADWCKNREISKAHAYRLIQLANIVEEFIASEILPEDEAEETISKFSQRALLALSEYENPVIEWVFAVSKERSKMTVKQVKSARADWIAATSELLPDEIKEKATAGTLPALKIAALADALEKVPESHQQAIAKDLSRSPDVDMVKDCEKSAKAIAKILDKGSEIQAIADQSDLDLEKIIDESLRIGNTEDVAKLIALCAQVQSLTTKLVPALQKAQAIADRIYVSSGASTPQVRSMLSALDSLCGYKIQVPVKDQYIQLEIKFETNAPNIF